MAFNVFINNFLIALYQSNMGVRIVSSSVNSVAYADYITLITATVTELQTLINMCPKYSQAWRFSFNVIKS